MNGAIPTAALLLATLGVGAGIVPPLPVARTAQIPAIPAVIVPSEGTSVSASGTLGSVRLGPPAANRTSARGATRATTAATRPKRTATPPNARPVRPHSSGTTLAGTASWYGTGGPGYYAAMHDYVDGTHVQVAVCAFPGGRATCITVPVVTQCGACRWTPGAVLVDLSVPAFRALGVPLSVGLARVTVEVLR